MILSDKWISKAESHWDKSKKSRSSARETMNLIEKAINLNPLNPRAWADKGFILKQLGDFHGALMCLDRALALKQDFIGPWYNKAVLLGLMGKFKDALACYNEVLRYDPGHEQAIRDRSALQQMMGKLK